jgi:hypothetical protein
MLGKEEKRAVMIVIIAVPSSIKAIPSGRNCERFWEKIRAASGISKLMMGIKAIRAATKH